jgi:hypothetical protein
MYLRTFSLKIDIYLLRNKTKKCRENAYFSTKFCNFYIGHIKSRFFSEPLHGHVEHEDVHITF